MPSQLYAPIDPAEVVIGWLIILAVIALVLYLRISGRTASSLMGSCRMCGAKHYRSDMVNDPYGYFCTEDEAEEFYERNYL